MQTYKVFDLAISIKDKWSGKIVAVDEKYVYVMDAKRTLATMHPGPKGPNVTGQVRIFDRDEFERKVIKNDIIIIPVEQERSIIQ